MFTIGMVYFAAALLASGIFIAAGFRSRLRVRLGGYGKPADALLDDPEADPSLTQAEIAPAIYLAFKRLGSILQSLSVQADVAVAPGLAVRMRAPALADLMEELVASAVHSAPASRVLVTASAQGDHVEVRITDDLPHADLAVRQARLRGIMERVALRGGSLDVGVRPAEGTTITLRLSAAGQRRVQAPSDAQPVEIPSQAPVFSSGTTH